MKLIALVLVRNEEWILEASLDAALRWCDGVALHLDRCTDKTLEIAGEVLSRSGKANLSVLYHDQCSEVHWNEMEKRQAMLEDGRKLGGTHFALIDADEILTYNLLPIVRQWVGGLQPGELLEVPMVPIWRDLDCYRHDGSIWSSVKLTLAFADKPDMGWAPRWDIQYQHHHRHPHKATQRVRVPCEGGVMHLQFADWRRLKAKHVWYRMVEHVRWPGRLSIADLNRTYDLALTEKALHTESVPTGWWGDYRKSAIMLGETPWHEAAIASMIQEHGREKFAGLDLKGY